MGCFFLISGFFSAKSLSMTISKGRTRRSAILQHLRGRLLRLGLPAAFFTLVMYPATLAIGIGKPITVDAYLTFLKGLRGVRGGAWWLSTALLFDTIFATYNGLGLPAIPVSRYLPPLTLAALPLMAWLWSSAFPFGTHIDPIHVHAPCLPQYLVAYFTGTWLSSNPQFIASRMLPKEARWRNSPLPALVLWLAYGVLLFKLPLTRSLLRDTTPLFVGGNLTSLLFGIWTELGFATLSHCAIRVAELVTRDRRRTVAKQSILPRLAYGAFLVHAILLCGIAVNLRSLRLSPVAKTLLVGSLATVASFAVSAVLTRFPGLRNII
ncbi:hypothetical protein BKA62DRAFT_298 [Auriculariales sp. MPI-PUGE-AT-0066]|nr:hypothetical protein BKA62DRAFT_298 [Auriculariales sp. MPI-PUGE-AT-0066]